MDVDTVHTSRSDTNDLDDQLAAVPAAIEVDLPVVPDFEPDVIAPPGRKTRIRRRPAKLSEENGFLPSPQYAAMSAYMDTQPAEPPSLPPTQPPSPVPFNSSRSLSPAAVNIPFVRPPMKYTEENELGLFRGYRQWPTVDREDQITLDDLSDGPTFVNTSTRGFLEVPDAPPEAVAPEPNENPYAPFSNSSVFHLMTWFMKTAVKSLNDLNSLVAILCRPDFKKEHLEDFDAATEVKRLDKQDEAAPDGWKESSVPIKLPQTRVKQDEETEAPEVEIPGLFHRNLTQVMVAACQDESAKAFTWRGYAQFWKPAPGVKAERVYGEVYTSPAFLEMEERVIAGHDPSDPHEPVVVPLLGYSDGSRLASRVVWLRFHLDYLRLVWTSVEIYSLQAFIFFGSSSGVHPQCAYLHFNLLTKLTLSLQLPDWIQDIYKKTFNKPASREIVSFLKRQLMHAIWFKLLDDEFMNVVIHGIVVVCADGVSRRLYPRFFTYSADYPEKCLLTGIKYLGTHPCALCLVRRDQIRDLGTRADARRRADIRQDSEHMQGFIETCLEFIYKVGRAVDGDNVKALLGKFSLAPVRVRPFFSVLFFS
jgi:hypothetical protein